MHYFEQSSDLLNISWNFHIHDFSEVMQYRNGSINDLATVRGEESFVNSFQVVHLPYFQQSTPGFKSSQYWNASGNFDATPDFTDLLNIRDFEN
jgi:hypothetical protein